MSSWKDEAKKSAARRSSSQPQTSRSEECQELLSLIAGGDHLLDDRLHKVFSTEEEICAWLRKSSLYLGSEAPAYFVRSMEFEPVLLALDVEYLDS